MTIQNESRSYTDNFRNKRRYLQGHGVNLRETIVVGSPYEDRAAGARIAVPGLKSDDDIISVINMDDLVDVTGYLQLGAAAAALSVFATGKGLDFTALRLGTGGNDINVKAVVNAAANQPLTVTIGAYDAVLVATGVDSTSSGNGGKTIILVQLASAAAGVAATDGDPNTAAKVRAAILNAQAGTVGQAIVDVAFPSGQAGGTAWTAQTVLPLAGGADFNQGPVAASLITALGGSNRDVRYVARDKGADGNSITVDYDTDGAADSGVAIVVAGSDIAVTVAAGESTAQDVVDAVNADADASALVIASLAPGQDGTGAIVASSPTALAGGLDPGIQLSETSSGVNLKVLWLTKFE